MNARNQNLNLCHILMEDKVSKTRGPKLPDKGRAASVQPIPDLSGSMFHQREVNASNLKLGAASRIYGVLSETFPRLLKVWFMRIRIASGVTGSCVRLPASKRVVT